jgi:hypothetical protein
MNRTEISAQLMIITKAAVMLFSMERGSDQGMFRYDDAFVGGSRYEALASHHEWS